MFGSQFRCYCALINHQQNQTIDDNQFKQRAKILDGAGQEKANENGKSALPER